MNAQAASHSRPTLSDVADDDLTEDQMNELADLELELIDSQLRVKELKQQLDDELRRRNRLIAQGVDGFGRTERWAVDVADISRATVHRALCDAWSREGQLPPSPGRRHADCHLPV